MLDLLGGIHYFLKLLTANPYWYIVCGHSFSSNKTKEMIKYVIIILLMAYFSIGLAANSVAPSSSTKQSMIDTIIINDTNLGGVFLNWKLSRRRIHKNKSIHSKATNFNFDFHVNLDLDGHGLFNSSISFNYRENKALLFGGGFGLTYGSTFIDEQSLVYGFANPFLYTKCNVLNKNWFVFFDSKAGYGFQTPFISWVEEHESGLFFQPRIGIDIANEKRLKWSIKISQFIQKTDLVPDRESVNDSYFINRTCLGFNLTL